jgi:hypothetical protein
MKLALVVILEKRAALRGDTTLIRFHIPLPIFLTFPIPRLIHDAVPRLTASLMLEMARFLGNIFLRS